MQEPYIKLRLATLNDASLLRYWDSQPHVLEAKNNLYPDADWNWETELARNPEWRELLIGMVDGRPVAFLQIINPAQEETHYWGNVQQHHKAIDIWIGEKSDLGKGYGTVLMNQAIERCFENGDAAGILIDPVESNTKAHRFYERLGFRFVEQRYFGDDSCYVYQLERESKSLR